jgi:hypothetical protein
LAIASSASTTALAHRLRRAAQEVELVRPLGEQLQALDQRLVAQDAAVALLEDHRELGPRDPLGLLVDGGDDAALAARDVVEAELPDPGRHRVAEHDVARLVLDGEGLDVDQDQAGLRAVGQAGVDRVALVVGVERLGRQDQLEGAVLQAVGLGVVGRLGVRQCHEAEARVQPVALELLDHQHLGRPVDPALPVLPPSRQLLRVLASGGIEAVRQLRRQAGLRPLGPETGDQVVDLGHRSNPAILPRSCPKSHAIAKHYLLQACIFFAESLAFRGFPQGPLARAYRKYIRILGMG